MKQVQCFIDTQNPILDLRKRQVIRISLKIPLPVNSLVSNNISNLSYYRSWIPTCFKKML